jgi:hypothetical protein
MTDTPLPVLVAGNVLTAVDLARLGELDRSVALLLAPEPGRGVRVLEVVNLGPTPDLELLGQAIRRHAGAGVTLGVAIPRAAMRGHAVDLLGLDEPRFLEDPPLRSRLFPRIKRHELAATLAIEPYNPPLPTLDELFVPMPQQGHARASGRARTRGPGRPVVPPPVMRQPRPRGSR